MPGHHHSSSADTQNQGNVLGDRACVRQSKLYRTHESGNGVKAIMGLDHLRWDTNQKEGAYKGHAVFDHNAPNTVSNQALDTKYGARDLKNNNSSAYSETGFRRTSGSNSDSHEHKFSLAHYQAPSQNRGIYQSDENSFRSTRNQHDVPVASEYNYKSLKAQKAGFGASQYSDDRSGSGVGAVSGGSYGYRSESNYSQEPPPAAFNPSRNASKPYVDDYEEEREIPGLPRGYAGRNSNSYGASTSSYGTTTAGDSNAVSRSGSKATLSNYYVNEQTVYGQKSNNDKRGDKSTRPW